MFYLPQNYIEERKKTFLICYPSLCNNDHHIYMKVNNLYPLKSAPYHWKKSEIQNTKKAHVYVKAALHKCNNITFDMKWILNSSLFCDQHVQFTESALIQYPWRGYTVVEKRIYMFPVDGKNYAIHGNEMVYSLSIPHSTHCSLSRVKPHHAFFFIRLWAEYWSVLS